MPTATALEISPATPADVPLIAQLVRELAEYEKAPQDAVGTDAMFHDALFGSRPAAEALVARLDGDPVGFALFFHNFSTWTARRGLYLEDLFVRPQYRGHGVGKALLERLGRIARERGCARMEWSVLDWNTPAVDFYRALGAVPMDGWTVFRLTGTALAALGADDPSPRST